MKEQKNKPSESSIQAQLACMLASAQQRPECSMFIGEPCTSQPDPDHNLLPPPSPVWKEGQRKPNLLKFKQAEENYEDNFCWGLVLKVEFLWWVSHMFSSL